ncbi:MULTISPECIES: DegT/DnrJ/EryC1/StrS aminotransferase family protein [Muribaculum]|uniref:DegT/DnrJ/EryC1/StrS family aminotransferase n=3 Tax=Bacteroidales TaxID=171549 RepID=UPI000F48A469|nr:MULTISPECIES: DegT/DnrJ/EryC1/StrS family aminotransferase [Muribaculum]MCX4277143.1 DegT/DnrJ/EryC1/StrS family aminotransferase [Muribaculum sp.]ROT12744.1 pyridoxal phosphate-dependent aminotransferase [Muribaculaceae bacterium Isolate-102 (HZI)]
MMEMIKLSLPHIGTTEIEWVNKAFVGDWVVPLGPNVDEFERRLENYVGDNKEVVALSAGTAALHLGLVVLGVEAGDEVICQALTFSASANPICYQGAHPVFVDSEPDTYNMSPAALEEAIVARHRVTGRYPKAIIPVHLYGMPAKMNEIVEIAAHYGIPVLEDAAEALGSEYHGKKCGTIGNYGALSFNGNKIITTSGGGALICPDEESARRVLFFATQARENRPYYYHEHIGYNYRLSNVSAGVGCGQMDVLPERVTRRRAIHQLYKEGLSNLAGVTVQCNPTEEFDSNFWLSTILIDPATGFTPEDVRVAMLNAKIETRLLWRPMQMQPIFRDAPYYGGDVSQRLFETGLCLPSGSVLTDEQISRVIDELHRILRG